MIRKTTGLLTIVLLLAVQLLFAFGEVPADTNFHLSPTTAVSDSLLPEVACSQCASSEVNLSGFYLGDINGNPITGSCTPGAIIPAYVWGQVSLQSGPTRYTLAIAYELSLNVNGQLTTFTDSLCRFTNQAITNSPVRMASVNWTCGSELTFNFLQISWQNNISSPCAYSTPRCRCLPVSTVRVPLSVSIVTTNVSCQGASNGTAFATPSGGQAPYAYLWSNGQTTSMATGLSPVVYTVTVTDNNNTTATASAIITEPPLLQTTISATPAFCSGSATGFATVIASGGTPPYQYFWSNGQTTASATELTAGVYTVTVSDINNCTATAIATIAEPAVLSTTMTNSPVSCFGANDGTVTVSVSGGTPGYSYAWSNGQTSQTVSGLIPGVYFVTATDANGCVVTASAVVTQPPSVTVTAQALNPSCPGYANGSAFVVASGGVPPYSYAWSGTTVQTTSMATGLIAGTYSVTVTDDNGCTAVSFVTITEPPPLNSSVTGTDALCFGSATGTAQVTASGGTSPYSYIWSNGQTTQTATGLPAGTYTVTVTDNNACTIVSSVTLSDPPQLTATASSTPATCQGGGTATVVAVGGVAPYSYLWSSTPVQTTATANGLSAGSYQVTVTDSNGCIATASVTVTAPGGLSLTTSHTDAICFGSSNGTASVTVTGGIPPYGYLWSNGQTTATATGLIAGTYTVTVTDSTGCIAVDQVVITEPAALVASMSSTPILCFGSADGTASVIVSGGTPGYTYLWSNGQTTQSAIGLSAGIYTVTVTDANNCVAVSSTTISEPPALVSAVTATYPLCFGFADGTASITATGGTLPYSYLWSNGQTTQTATGLLAGTYTVTVTDASACTIVSSVTLSDPAQLSATASSTPATCQGGGTATVAAAGGAAPYSYLWSSTPVQTTATANGLSAGSYQVTVTDSNGCIATASVTVTAPGGLSLTTSHTDAICFGGSDGTASVSVAGGIPPYSYLWSNGQTTATATGLIAGTYAVTVTDSTGCIAVDQVVITEPAALVASISSTPILCSGSADGTASVIVSGGTPGYTYLWSNGQTTQSAIGLSAGIYTVTVTDANNCVAVSSTTISEPPALVSAVTATDPLCFGFADGIASITATGGTLPYSYLWSNGQTTQTATGLPAGTSTVTVTDASACTIVSTITLTNPQQHTVSTTATAASCAGANTGTVEVIAAGGATPYTYLWNNGATTSFVSQLVAGIYHVTVTDGNGCQLVDSVNVTEPPQLSVNLIASDVSCFGGNDGLVIADPSGGTPPYAYLWNTGDTSAVITNLTSTFYRVTITDNAGCEVSDSVFVGQPILLQVIATGTDVNCFGSANGSAEVLATGGSLPYVYSWSSGQTSSQVLNLTPGLYTVSVSDANNCTSTAQVTIVQPFQLTASATASHPTCANSSDGTASIQVSGGTLPYSYAWSNGQTLATAVGLIAGTYTVTATDENGCSIVAQVILEDPQPLQIGFSTTGVSCFGGTDGSATTVVSGGNTPLIYSWSNGNTTSSVTGLAAGSYSLTVTDANNCSATAVVAIDEPTILTASVFTTSPTCNSSGDGTASVVVQGGIAPYQYVWGTVPPQTSATAVQLAAGTYQVTVTDANQCVITAAAVVSNPPAGTPCGTVIDSNITAFSPIYLNMLGSANIVLNPAHYQPQKDSVFLSRQVFGCSDAGDTVMIQVSVTDTSLIPGQTYFNRNVPLIILDTIAPVLQLPPAAQIYLDALGQAQVSFALLDMGSWDSCGIDFQGISHPP
jgi:hypothetical protein